jgi:putative ATPase
MEILANILRPKKLNDVIGQQDLIGKDKIIYNLVHNQHLFSMILYGNPGTGKTSIANAICNEMDLPHLFLNATINKKEDFDNAINEAKINGGLILIVDEIHRMNKDKQDILLPYVENGLITLIGLTTSNPFHTINPAIRSRCQIFELKDLTTEDITKGLKKAIKSLENIKINNDTLKYIANLSNGDLRYAINLLEIAYYSTSDGKITLDLIKSINNKPSFNIDAAETGHYDVLSALQKSIRGSDVNASLHYASRLIAQNDLDSLFRRLSVIAYEDIGLANPGIGPRLDAAIHAAERVGMPEARIPIGEIVVEMALSPKSNSAYLALDDALNDFNKGNFGNIPDNIKYHNTTYVYPHNYPHDYVKQNYMPDKLIGKTYYHQKNNPIENNLNKAYEDMTGNKNH